jgi:hypothetical protein
MDDAGKERAMRVMIRRMLGNTCHAFHCLFGYRVHSDNAGKAADKQSPGVAEGMLAPAAPGSGSRRLWRGLAPGAATSTRAGSAAGCQQAGQ